MELEIEQALQKGIETHKTRQFQEADRMYTAILKAQPQHPDANHNLGVPATQLDKAEQALWFFEQALRVNTKVEKYWLSCGNVQRDLGDLLEAESSYRRALELNPDDVGTHRNITRLLTMEQNNRFSSYRAFLARQTCR